MKRLARRLLRSAPRGGGVGAAATECESRTVPHNRVSGGRKGKKLASGNEKKRDKIQVSFLHNQLTSLRGGYNAATLPYAGNSRDTAQKQVAKSKKTERPAHKTNMQDCCGNIRDTTVPASNQYYFEPRLFVCYIRTAWKGGLPSSISYSRTPTDQTSTLLV